MSQFFPPDESIFFVKVAPDANLAILKKYQFAYKESSFYVSKFVKKKIDLKIVKNNAFLQQKEKLKIFYTLPISLEGPLFTLANFPEVLFFFNFPFQLSTKDRKSKDDEENNCDRLESKKAV